jgi:hypothetical protein
VTPPALDSRERARFRVLHALRIKGAADAEAVQRSSGLSEAAGELARLTADALIVRRDTPAGAIYALSAEGRALHLGALRDEVEGAARDRLGAAYDAGFLPLNARFKELCTRWQQADAHFELLEEALDVHDAIEAFLQDAERGASHLAVYRPRFAGLIELVEAGDVDVYVAPVGESYHNVWFELHEDLLVTLARSRSDEDS